MIYRVVISQECLDVLYTDISRHRPRETGGALMGEIQGGVLTIRKCILGGPKAVREVAYFEADHPYVEMEIDLEYANSKGRHCYAGEWHSHPQRYPAPSSKDYQSFFTIAHGRDDTDPVFLIFGYVGLERPTMLEQGIAIYLDKQEQKFYQLPIVVK